MRESTQKGATIFSGRESLREGARVAQKDGNLVRKRLFCAIDI
jgi:hypothetical protein